MMPTSTVDKTKEIRGIALRYGFMFVILYASMPMCEADVLCEELPVEWCAYSISSGGARCVLEGEKEGDNTMVYRCETSSVETKIRGGWIEADGCMEACGLSRMTLGLSSQSLIHAQLCSSRCSLSCPHLQYLLQLPVAEGISMGDLCLQLNNPQRSMQEWSWSRRNGGHQQSHGGMDKRTPCEGSASCGGGGDGFAFPPYMSAGGGGGGNGFAFPPYMSSGGGGGGGGSGVNEGDDVSQHQWYHMRHGGWSGKDPHYFNLPGHRSPGSMPPSSSNNGGAAFAPSPYADYNGE